MKDDDEAKLIFYIIDKNINFVYIYTKVDSPQVTGGSAEAQLVGYSRNWQSGKRFGNLASGRKRFSQVTKNFSAVLFVCQKKSTKKKIDPLDVEKKLKPCPRHG